MCTHAATRFEKDLTVCLRLPLANHQDGQQRHHERGSDQ
jgi:hypothetical protein